MVDYLRVPLLGVCVALFVNTCMAHAPCIRNVYVHNVNEETLYTVEYFNNVSNITHYRLNVINHTNCTEPSPRLKYSNCWFTNVSIHEKLQNTSDYIRVAYASVPLELLSIDDIEESYSDYTISKYNESGQTSWEYENYYAFKLGLEHPSQNLYSVSHQDFCTHPATAAKKTSSPLSGYDIYEVANTDMRSTVRRPTNARNGSGVHVYILDSGCDCFNSGITCSNTNYICTNSGCNTATHTQLQDDSGHGTHCAGIVQGQYVGIAPNVTLVIMKLEPLTDYSVRNALDQVFTDYEADPTIKRIVSVSLGFPQCAEGERCSQFSNCTAQEAYGVDNFGNQFSSPTSTWSIVHTQLRDVGIPIVKSAGNDACSVFDVWTTGNKDSLIVVGNAKMVKIDVLGFSWLSSRGFCGINSISTNFGPLVDINAPGSFILSTGSSTVPSNDNTYITSPVQPSAGQYNVNRYRYLTGTSMAAPLVAGVIALMLNTHNDTNMTVDNIRVQLQTNWSFPDAVEFFSAQQQGYYGFVSNTVQDEYNTTTRRVISSYNRNIAPTNTSVTTTTTNIQQSPGVNSTTPTSATPTPTTSQDNNNIIIIASAVGGVIVMSLVIVVIYNFASAPGAQYELVSEFF